MKFKSIWIIFFLPEGLSEAFIGCKTLHSCFRWEEDICLMQYANVMQCMILHERKCPCIKFISFILSLLDLPLSHPCTLHGSVVFVYFFYPKKQFYLDIFQPRRISFFHFWKQTHFLFNHLSMKHRTFRLYALDFTTLALSINFAWIMKNH